MAIKKITGLILLAKGEASYGQGAAVTGSTDAVSTCMEFPLAQIEYADDGDRGIGPFSRARLLSDSPTGRTTKFNVKAYAKGRPDGFTLGAPSIHAFLLAAGLSASLAAGSATYVPCPVLTEPTSFAAEIYDASEELPVSGALCSFSYGAQGAKPVVFDFAVSALAGTPIDVASYPARVYPASGTIAPTAKNLSLSIGGYSGLVVRDHKVTVNADIQPRINQNGVDGHAGFTHTLGDITLDLTVELPAKASFDPFADFAAATAKAITLTLGSNAGNQIVTSIPSAQLSKAPVKANDGKIRTVQLTYTAKVLTPDANNHFSLTWQ